jgi:nitronate monooxygenase
MPIKTQLTEMLGIEHPIVCGGMTGTGTVELTAAISETGCLGMLTALNFGTPEGLTKAIADTRALTSKPFGVNLTILPALVPPDVRMPFSCCASYFTVLLLLCQSYPLQYDGFAQSIIDNGVKVVETAGNNPKKWAELFHKHGIIHIHKCIAIRHALSAQKCGVDILSVDGFECAGHPGEDDIGNFVMLAKAAKVLDTCFIASGGVADGKQLAAAIALGAAGVNMGTRFCATKECNWPKSYKDKMIEASELETVIILRALKNSTRVFKNEVSDKVVAIEKEKGDDFQITDVMDLVAGKRGREAESNGDADGGIWTAGQVIGLIDDIPTCQELVTTFMAEAEQVVGSMSAVLVAKSRL